MATVHHSSDLFPVHSVPVTRPFIWLGRGLDDIRHTPAASLAYGWIVATLGALILAYSRHPLYIAVAVASFLMVGPVITAGLCELSRRRDHGEPVSFQLSLAGLASSRQRLANFCCTLLLLAIAWFTLCAAVLFFAAGNVVPDLESTVWGNVFSQLSAEQLTVYALAFIALAGTVFAVSVVTVPMMIDRHVDAVTAMRTSLRAAVRDWPAMLLWAVLIVGLVLFGFATWLLGMVIVLPLLGHATWHAYRDIVEEA